MDGRNRCEDHDTKRRRHPDAAAYHAFVRLMPMVVLLPTQEMGNGLDGPLSGWGRLNSG
jgi:hypothetical protein